MLRAIREIRPTWVVGENVRGLINWSKGMVFEQVQADLEAEGYEVTPFILPACSVEAPHQRDRIWFIAYSSKSGLERGRWESKGFEQGCEEDAITNSNSHRLQRSISTNINKELQREGGDVEEYLSTLKSTLQFKNFPTQSPLRGGDDGLPSQLDGITVSNWSRKSIQAYGNAIVPQVVYQIFKTISEFENLKPSQTIINKPQ